MRNLTPFLIVSFSTTLGACAPEPETGIDRTVLSGTVQITPHLSVEDESVVGVNDAIIDNLFLRKRKAGSTSAKELEGAASGLCGEETGAACTPTKTSGQGHRRTTPNKTQCSHR